MKSYKELQVWIKAHEQALEIYKITMLFPKIEIYGITSQLRRSASSVAANIAEGFSRYSTKEFIQYLYQSRGSLSEAQYFLLLSRDLDYIDNLKYIKLDEKYNVLGKQLNALISSLKTKNGAKH